MRRYQFVLGASLLCIGVTRDGRSAPPSSATHNAVIRRPFENIGATISWGYDSRTGEFKTPCVRYTDRVLKTAPVTGPGGEASEQQFKVVKTFEETSSALGLDFSASARYLIGSAHVSFKLNKNVKVSSYSSTAILHMSLEKSARFAETWEPVSNEIKKLARDPVQFRNRCGDSFVYLVIEGGELNASVSASGSSSSEQERIGAAFAVATAQYNVDGKLDVALASMRSASQLEIINYARGGTATFTDDQLKDLAKRFYADARQNPWVLELRTLGYENVAGLPFASYQTEPTQIGSCIFQLYQYEDALDYIDHNKAAFTALKPNQLKEEQTKVGQAIAWLKDLHEKNVSTWSHRCPILPNLPARTTTTDLNITVCGWNPLAFVPASDSGWTIRTTGSWCAHAGDCNTGTRQWTDPGAGFQLRCVPEGDAAFSTGPCHLQSIIGDNQCSDNEPKAGAKPQVEISENLPLFDLTHYQQEIRAVPTAKDLK
jgi:hypothetical protein